MRTVVLPSVFDIQAVTAASADLLDALETGGLAIDAGSVTRIDAAALQLLYATVATAHARGARVTWSARSAVLEEAARMLALVEALELPASRMQEAA